jgi:hypothetical protein
LEHRRPWVSLPERGLRRPSMTRALVAR